MDNKEFISKEDFDKEIHRLKDEFDNEINELIGKDEYDEFKRFAFKDKMIDMSIAFILGASFKSVVNSIANNIFMPFINYITQQAGNDWRELKYEPLQGLNFEIGLFIGSFVDFLLTAIILYIIYKKLLKKWFGEKQ